MSRRRVAEKTTILPDPKYGDMVLAKFINIIMRSGKKSIAEKIVYKPDLYLRDIRRIFDVCPH